MLVTTSFIASPKDISAISDITFPSIADTSPLVEVHFRRIQRGIEVECRSRIPVETIVPVVHEFESMNGDSHRQVYVRISKDMADVRQLGQDIVASLALLFETPTSIYSIGRPEEIIAESATDQALIDSWGTNKVEFGLRAGRVVSRSRPNKFKSSLISDLLPRAAGLHLYNEALKAATAVSEFRDYWRILESAFGLIDHPLTKHLAQYTPAIALNFDTIEIENLWVWRGRASHANSNAGIGEIQRVHRECANLLPRLKLLAKTVILTKQHWGTRSLAVEEVGSFVRIEYSPD